MYANSPFGGLPYGGGEISLGSISCGIHLGKKGPFSIGYGGIQKLDGWLDLNSSTPFPEYSMPSGIPEWVNAYNPSTHGNDDWYTQEGSYFQKRFLCGTGTNSLGPFELHEAVYVYSVLKTYAVDGYIGITNNYWGNSTEPPDYEQNPKSLFRPQYKSVGYGEYFLDGGFYSGYAEGYGYGDLYIVADVDNLSDYYIVGPALTYNSMFSWRGGADGGGNFSVAASLYKSSFTFDGVTLSEIGDSHSKTYELGELSYTVTLTYIGISVSYTFGSVSGTAQLYGAKQSYVFSDGESNDPSYPSSLSVSGIEYWPYKTANGQPVYNTTTGAIINSPIP